jgi:hypothetical protein
MVYVGCIVHNKFKVPQIFSLSHFKVKTPDQCITMIVQLRGGVWCYKPAVGLRFGTSYFRFLGLLLALE